MTNSHRTNVNLEALNNAEFAAKLLLYMMSQKTQGQRTAVAQPPMHCEVTFDELSSLLGETIALGLSPLPSGLLEKRK